jgi:hypothetical protein
MLLLMHSLYLEIYQKRVKIISSSTELIGLLEKDFSYFVSDSKPEVDFSLEVYFIRPPFENIPKGPSLFQSQNSITYQQGKIRFNDYYGKLLSVYNYETELGKLYSEDLCKLHEITYLLILSRVGKILDLEGVHRLHAFGVVYRDTAIICSMPSKGGKSSLLMSLLANPEVKLLSDDSPLVLRNGKVKAFPLRIGLGFVPESFSFDKRYAYSITREQYGEKKLLSLKGIKNELGDSYKKIILLEGRRGNIEGASFNPVSKIKMYKGLIQPMIIGVGLPMIFEYFWETGLRDFFRKTKIALSRSLAALNLVMRSKTFVMYNGCQIERNAQELLKLVDRVKQ